MSRKVWSAKVPLFEEPANFNLIFALLFTLNTRLFFGDFTLGASSLPPAAITYEWGKRRNIPLCNSSRVLARLLQYLIESLCLQDRPPLIWTHLQKHERTITFHGAYLLLRPPSSQYLAWSRAHFPGRCAGPVNKAMKVKLVTHFADRITLSPKFRWASIDERSNTETGTSLQERRHGCSHWIASVINEAETSVEHTPYRARLKLAGQWNSRQDQNPWPLGNKRRQGNQVKF